jgi:hypothetical protein
METPFFVVGKLKCDNDQVCYSAFILDSFICKLTVSDFNILYLFRNDSYKLLVRSYYTPTKTS